MLLSQILKRFDGRLFLEGLVLGGFQVLRKLDFDASEFELQLHQEVLVERLTISNTGVWLVVHRFGNTVQRLWVFHLQVVETKLTQQIGAEVFRNEDLPVFELYNIANHERGNSQEFFYYKKDQKDKDPKSVNNNMSLLKSWSWNTEPFV